MGIDLAAWPETTGTRHMDNVSVWHAGAPASAFPTLPGDTETDVVIVGGGITGVTLAALLADAGRRVVVLEALRIGEGTTGHSTGNLYGTVGDLQALHSAWDNETARRVVQSRLEAVNLVESIARRLPPEVGFKRVPHFIYAVDSSAEDSIRSEHEVVRSTGLPCTLEQSRALRHAVGPVLRIDGQAQFHPLAYVRTLARAISSATCQIFENAEVLEVDHEARSVRTARGTVRANEVVLATHTPKGIFGLHAEMLVHREYAVAGPATASAPPDAINWGRGSESHSARHVVDERGHWLVVIGGEVKTGRHDGNAEQRKVDQRANALFGLDPQFRWSAQNYRSPDFIPYIGRSRGVETMIATGFAADGLTYGTLAARLLADQIVGRDNPYSELYSGRRITPVKSAPRLIQENVLVLKSFMQDYVTDRKSIPLDEVQAGSGAIVDYHGERVAAYKATDGSVTMVSPVCTHMKCLVHWNSAETTWDCPCHGSRFSVDGRVLEGPALQPLPAVRPRAKADG
jgi:glycine/D-amino acid oxidase-like deaminating enzyme/nitrite reductase/ring-hydroxylating ferredoxin subunit